MAEDNRDIKKARSLRTDGGICVETEESAFPWNYFRYHLVHKTGILKSKYGKKCKFTKPFKSNKKHLKDLIATCF